MLNDKVDEVMETFNGLPADSSRIDTAMYAQISNEDWEFAKGEIAERNKWLSGLTFSEAVQR